MVYKIKISPESLSSIVKEITYSGNTFGVYTGMTSLLTSGVNGSSSLTGLTIPILLTQDCIDIGYYSEFDGAIKQKETALNYVFSANSEYEYCIYNTSILSSYTKGSEYEILSVFDFNKYKFGLIHVEHNFEEPKRQLIKEL